MHHRPAPTSDRNRSGASGLTGKETAAWFPDTLDDALEKADAPQHEGPSLPPRRRQHLLDLQVPRTPAGTSRKDSALQSDVCVDVCQIQIEQYENRLPTTSKTTGCCLANLKKKS